MDTDQIAVRVNNVSKIYRLWATPQDRLIHPLKQVVASFLPARFREVDGQSPRYRPFHALHDVSLEIRKGESWGIIGVNGSGKSTLLKIISGNLRPSAGSAEVDGKVAILDFGSGFNGEFTGEENIYLKAALQGLTTKQISERFESIVEFAELGEFIKQPVKTYSSGMGARLGFAIMAHVDADILITDEALAVGDVFFVQKCMRYIRSFLDRGTFLFVSHSVNDVLSLCSHALWLDHGRVVQIGKSKKVCEAYMNSVVRKKSERFLQDEAISDGVTPNLGDQPAAGREIKQVVQPSMRTESKRISVSAQDLAVLKDHYAPRADPTERSVLRTSRIEICEPAASDEDVMETGAAVGGGRIFEVSIADDQGRALPLVRGGEMVCLTIRAVAERFIKRPLLGFQLKNRIGLALLGENTHLAMGDQVFSLQPGEVISAKFHFMMPLVAPGDYVIRASLHDGVQGKNVAVDIIYEALLLHCVTSGDRHGLVGAALLAIDITHDVGLQW